MHIAVANVWLAVVVAVLQITPASAAHGSSWDSHARRSLSARKLVKRDVDVHARDGLLGPILGE